jgi:hypothetical protein
MTTTGNPKIHSVDIMLGYRLLQQMVHKPTIAF